MQRFSLCWNILKRLSVNISSYSGNYLAELYAHIAMFIHPSFVEWNRNRSFCPHLLLDLHHTCSAINFKIYLSYVICYCYKLNTVLWTRKFLLAFYPPVPHVSTRARHTQQCCLCTAPKHSSYIIYPLCQSNWIYRHLIAGSINGLHFSFSLVTRNILRV